MKSNDTVYGVRVLSALSDNEQTDMLYVLCLAPPNQMTHCWWRKLDEDDAGGGDDDETLVERGQRQWDKDTLSGVMVRHTQ